MRKAVRWQVVGGVIASVLMPVSARATVTGTSGDDFLFFNGSLQTLATTLTNPYTGESINVNGSYNVNIDTYDGLAGNDTLLFTNVGDLLTLRNGSNQQTSFNIERFVAGDGADIISLADASFTQGNIFVDGGPQGDVMWGNIGNDTMQGATGNDTLNGGPGNDRLLGQDDNDIFIFALGMGVDTISGGNGFDEVDFRPGITQADVHWTGVGMEFDIGSGGDHISLDTLEQFRFADNSTADPVSFTPEPSGALVVLSVGALGLRRRRIR